MEPIAPHVPMRRVWLRDPFAMYMTLLITSSWLLALLFVLVFTLGHATPVDQYGNPRGWLGLFQAIGAAEIPFVLFCTWLVLRQQSVINGGAHTPGAITHISSSSHGLVVGYTYEWQGVSHNAARTIVATRATKRLSVGQAITVMLREANPSRSFVREVYTLAA